jgi:hypothetical protein
MAAGAFRPFPAESQVTKIGGVNWIDEAPERVQ